ncbi:hypothetical protein AB205_0161560 [Aquarana catesbeiana]|uniref:Uncharacterized protein n=1 Tax=Aquarana catesbeiana TaxID=8400 RepID=A0A2G9RCR4_AQUCT|nr:hypothetical protein AB205_0161560 [Aquarana catesbeiana]
MGRKDSGHLRTPRTPHLLKKGKSQNHKQRMRREMFMKWAKLSSQQILIGEIMGCNHDLEHIKENINDGQQKMKNIIDFLGRI